METLDGLCIGRWTSSAPQWRAPALWSGLEYDPNRSARIALVRYPVGAPLPPTAFASQVCLQGVPSVVSAACRVHGGHVTLRVRRLL